MAYGSAISRISSVILILKLSLHLALGDVVPVYIWGPKSEQDNLPATPAFGGISSIDLEKNYLQKFIADKSIVVAFIQDTLSSEDLGIYSSAFKNLQSSATVLPNVENPVSSFKILGEKVTLTEVSSAVLTGDIDFPSDVKTQLFIVTLPSTADSTNRFAALQRNDKLIGKFLQTLKNKQVVAVYTGIKPSWQSPEPESEVHLRVARDVETTEAPVDPKDVNLYFVNYTTVYAYATNGTIDVKTADFSELVTLKWPPKGIDVKNVEPIEVSNGTFEIHWGFENMGNFTDIKFDMSFNNLSHSGFWKSDYSALSFKHPRIVDSSNVQLNTAYLIGASRGFSFSCSNCTWTYKLKNDTTEDYTAKFRLENFQLEFVYKIGSKRFADSFDCYTFFTVPIWMGLAVTILFTAILAMGIFMLFEVKTMDKFDDPKGKTISVPLTD